MITFRIPLFTIFAFIGSISMAAPLDIFRDCDVCPEMIELPMGEFMMGAPEGEAQQEYHWFENRWQPVTPKNPFIAHGEGPVHPVTIDIPFAMGRNEVAYDEWMACVADGGCNGHVPDPTVLGSTIGGDIVSSKAMGSHPVMRVSYGDAQNYVDWLNAKAGTIAYRLPTEAEWEFAARAGTQTAFAQGPDVTEAQVNYSDQKKARGLANGNDDHVYTKFPVPVEALDAANEWGLRHMSGNIRELTLSCWSDRHECWTRSTRYLIEAQPDADCRRVTRSGGYHLGKNFSRLGARGSTKGDTRLPDLGFRVVRMLSPAIN